MQMVFWRSKLTVVLGAIIALSYSCTRPEESLGLGIQPGEDILAVNQFDTLTVVPSTKISDSLRTDELLYSLLGNYVDPVFGSSRASLYAQIRLSSNDVDFGIPENVFVDSLVLSFKYSGFTYGKTQPQTFEVYEIDEEFSIDSSYYSNQELLIKEENLVLQGYDVVSPDFLNGLTIGEDSVGPQLRIHLDTNFAKSTFLSQSGLDPLSDNDAFLSYFKGLLIQSTTLDGGIMSLDLLHPDSKLTMYYRDLNGELADTTSFVFNINNLCSNFYHINHSRSLDLSLLNNQDSIPANPNTYVQAGANVYTKIDFPFIDDLKQIDGLVINKAELVVPIEEEPFGRYPQPGTLLLRRPLNGKTALLPENLTFNFNEGGGFDQDLGAYVFNVSRFIQQCVSDEIDEKSLLVIIEDRYALANGTADPSVKRVVLHGSSFDPVDSLKNMRLILTYSY